MKINITIKPIDEKLNSISLSTSYTWKGGIRALTSPLQFKDFAMGESYQSMPSYVYDARFHELRYSYDKDKKNDKENTDTMSVVEDFWGNHPLMQVNGKNHNHTKAPMFNLFDETIYLRNEYDSFRDKLRVINMVNDMSFENKKDVVYFHGETPAEKTNEQLTLLLVKFDTGICLSNPKEFLNTWGVENKDRDTMVIIRMAIEQEVITTKHEQGRYDYFLNNTHLGTSVYDILSYCKKEEPVYKNHIYRAVTGKSSTEKKEETKRPVAQTEQTEQNMPTAKEIEELRDEAKELKKQGYLSDNVHNLKYEKLMPILIAGRKEKAAEMELERADAMATA